MIRFLQRKGRTPKRSLPWGTAVINSPFILSPAAVWRNKIKMPPRPPSLIACSREEGQRAIEEGRRPRRMTTIYVLVFAAKEKPSTIYIFLTSLLYFAAPSFSPPIRIKISSLLLFLVRRVALLRSPSPPVIVFSPL